MNSVQSSQRRAAIATLLMVTTGAASMGLVPTKRLADLRPPFNLEQLIPKQFGVWRHLPSAGGVVNPQTQDLISKIYTQTVSRTYVNDNGKIVMLSIAYGADQADNGNHLHYPEVCYPAQGFQLSGMSVAEIEINGKTVPVKRLATKLGASRSEPVTYWMVYGDHLSQGGWAGWSRRFAELRHGLKGEIVDGTLVRISSLGSDLEANYQLHAQFAREMMAAVATDGQALLLGR